MCGTALRGDPGPAAESIQASIQRLFDAAIIPKDLELHDFFGALYKLGLKMVSM